MAEHLAENEWSWTPDAPTSGEESKVFKKLDNGAGSSTFAKLEDGGSLTEAIRTWCETRRLTSVPPPGRLPSAPPPAVRTRAVILLT